MSGFYVQGGKRFLDIALASAALVASSPILALACLAILVEDQGSPIFRQTRTGAGGSLFTIYKLRSMPIGTADLESREASTLRITRVGSAIRRLSIDELPQLINVIRGNMSIVGPRPALPEQTTLLQLRSEAGAAHLKPGLTGLAQIRSYDGMPEGEKARYDGVYARSLSFAGDPSIIARTALYLLKPPPTY